MGGIQAALWVGCVLQQCGRLGSVDDLSDLSVDDLSDISVDDIYQV